MALAIVIVDSSSTDGTRAIAMQKGVTVLDAPMGKAEAMRYALGKLKADYVVMMDADNTYPAQHIPDLLEKLRSGYDVAMGYRRGHQPGAMSLLHKFGNSCLSLWASLLFGVRVHDVCTGMWAFKAEVLQQLALTSSRFTLEADLFASTVKGKFRLAQVPISYRARPDGSKAKLRMMDGFRIAAFLLRKRLGE